MVLCYTRNKHVSVVSLAEDRLRVNNRLEDTHYAAEVEIEVTVPDLEVVSVHGAVERSFNEDCENAIPLLQKALGLRVGSGLTKLIDSLVGETQGCRQTLHQSGSGLSQAVESPCPDQSFQCSAVDLAKVDSPAEVIEILVASGHLPLVYDGIDSRLPHPFNCTQPVDDPAIVIDAEPVSGKID